MGIKDDDLLKFRRFPSGVNNVLQEANTPTDESGNQTTLRTGENIMLDNSGKAQRRTGYTLRNTLVNGHSLYAHPLYPFMLCVASDSLIAFNASLQLLSVIALVDGDTPMSYSLAAGKLYYSNGVDSGLIDEDLIVRPWSVECPPGPPNVAAYSAGGLQRGTFQLCITFLNASGEESGASVSTEIDLVEGQGIQLTQMPQPVSAQVSTIRVYVSPPDGDVMYQVVDLPRGTLSTIVGVHTPGLALDKQFLVAMPPGNIVRALNGILFCAKKRAMFFSEAMMYGLTKKQDNYLSFNDTITLMEPAGEASSAGMFIAAGERTYFMSGATPKDWQRRIVYTAGAVANSAIQVDVKDFGLETSGILPVWLASDGQILLGTSDGSVIKLHDNNFVGRDHADHATLAMRDWKGIHQLIAVQRGGAASGFSAGDSAEAEVWRADGTRVS